MNTLIINRQERARSLDTLYSGLAANLGDARHVKLGKTEIDNLPETLRKLDAARYDRVLFDIPVRRAAHALKEIRAIPGLIYYEEDAYQEFLKISKFYKRFLKFFRDLNGCPVIVTGYNIANHLSGNGINAVCIPKGYDDAELSNQGRVRDIELAFVGRDNNRVYQERRTLLDKMEAVAGLQRKRSETSADYCDLLNRISLFFSADIGFNEHMAKNFEAMACGCVLVARRQVTEDEHLGFVDMDNVVLYDSDDEALKKIEQLRADPALRERIRERGARLVQERHKLTNRVNEFQAVLTGPYPERSAPAGSGAMATLKRLFRR